MNQFTQVQGVTIVELGPSYDSLDDGALEKLDELLIGAKAGEHKEMSVEVPKTFFREEYRGKKVDIQIDIQDVKWLKPAELDENFLKRYEVVDEDELREKIQDSSHR